LDAEEPMADIADKIHSISILSAGLRGGAHG